MAGNFFEADLNLQRALARSLGPAYEGWRPMLSDFGAWVATEVDAAASYTDRKAPPVLEAYGPDGRNANRILQTPGGLAVSREIVEAHDGSIGFVSASGRGSTFWLELPRHTPRPRLTDPRTETPPRVAAR